MDEVSRQRRGIYTIARIVTLRSVLAGVSLSGPFTRKWRFTWMEEPAWSDPFDRGMGL